MRTMFDKKYALGLVLWTLAVLLIAGTLDRLGANAVTAGIIFLAMVVWASTKTERSVSLYLAMLCAVLLDYFFLPKFHNFKLEGTTEWVAAGVFVVCGIVVSGVAEQARRQTRHAERRREDVERLYLLSQEMMLHEDSARLIRDLPYLLDRIFQLGGVVLFVTDQDEMFSSVTDLPAGLKANLNLIANENHPMVEILGGFAASPLPLGLRVIGSLGWRSKKLSREAASAMCAQVAIALARASAIETTTRIEATRESERLRTALIDSLTHELRTPLTSIRVASSTLMQAEGLDEASYRDLAAIVDEESTRLDLLIREAVEMAEIDANVVHVEARECHVEAFLEEVVEQSRSVLANHRVEILVEARPDTLWFDPQLLSRVFRHLLENAARYTSSGSKVVIHSWCEEDHLEFSVADNGPGIDPPDLPLIFEKFYRGKYRTAGKSNGSGMGLAIAKAIVRAHGGDIYVENLPGSGAVFTFWIPLVVKQQ